MRLSEEYSILSHIHTIDNALSDESLILDIGCGDGIFLRNLLAQDESQFVCSYKIGLDIFIPYLMRAKQIYDDVIRCDLRFLPVRAASCDIALASQVIEHLEKKYGLRLINDLESVARKVVIITVPVGFNPKQHLEDGNPWQSHVSGWHPNEFSKRKFKVYGYAGGRFLLGEREEFKEKSIILAPLIFILSLLTQLITRRLVTASYQMLCIKEMRTD